MGLAAQEVTGGNRRAGVDRSATGVEHPRSWARLAIVLFGTVLWLTAALLFATEDGRVVVRHGDCVATAYGDPVTGRLSAAGATRLDGRGLPVCAAPPPE